MAPAFKILYKCNGKLNPLETAGLGRMLNIFVVSLRMLQIFPLILEFSPLPWIILIFLNKIFLEIKTFSNFPSLLIHLDLNSFYHRMSHI